MLQLVELNIRIGVVDERVQEFERFKNAHLPVIEAQKFFALTLNEVKRLLSMILAIEFAHRVAGGLIVVTVAFAGLRARLRIHLLLDELLPRMKPVLLTRIGDRRIVHRAARESTV